MNLPTLTGILMVANPNWEKENILMDSFFLILFCISFILLVILLLTSSGSSTDERTAILGTGAAPEMPVLPNPAAVKIVQAGTRAVQPFTISPILSAGQPEELPASQPFTIWTVDMPDETFDYLLESAWQDVFQEKYLPAVAALNAMLEYRLTPEQRAWVVYHRGTVYDLMGQKDLALDDYLEADDLGIDDLGLLNAICWNYAITNRPNQALPFCEEAVEGEAISQFLDSRGLVYAQLGRFPEAVNDFERAIRLDGFPSDQMKATRREWLKTLKTGTNPITEEVLAAERGEAMPVTLVACYEGAPSLSYLKTEFEDRFGYIFQKTIIAGQPALKGTLRQGGCLSEITLVAQGEQITGAEVDIRGCTPEEGANRALDFMYAFARDRQESARIFSWSNVDWLAVLQGEKPVSTYTQSYGGFDFRLYRHETSGDVSYIVEAAQTG
jgi:hypothetical protein